MLRTENLSYKYKNGNAFTFPDFSCESNNALLLLGQSGVGKTTLLHLLAGLMKPKNGKIEINGQDMTSLSSGALDTFRGKNIGIVFQQNHFVKSLNVIENLILAQSMAGNPVDKSACQNLLDQLNIGEKANKRIHKLSQGERQRVAIARALVNRPKILLADEPTSALDDENCKAVMHLLQNQAKQYNTALIVVTHDNRLKEMNILTVELSKKSVS